MKKIILVFFVSLITFILSSCNQKEISTGDNMIAEQQALPGQEDLLKKYKTAVIKTNYGDITVEFYGKESPITVNNFLNLAKKGFYDGTKFHRIIKGFMIQGGDPNSRDKDISTHGLGGPGYKFQDEINNHKLVRGSVAMANAGANTNGSQFFIVTKDATPWLDGKHTNFGKVISGIDVIDKIEGVPVDKNDHPIADALLANIKLKDGDNIYNQK